MGKFKKKKNSAGPPKDRAPAKPLSRKEKRKADRKSKKQQKNALYLKRHAKQGATQDLEDVEQNVQATNDHTATKDCNHKPSKNKKDAVEKLKKASLARRKKLLIEENKREEENLKRLEKQLNLGTRKKKKKDANPNALPKSFVEDGLDFILDACDSSKIANLGNDSEGEEMAESNSDQEGLSDFERGEQDDSSSGDDMDDGEDDIPSNESGDDEINSNENQEIGNEMDNDSPVESDENQEQSEDDEDFSGDEDVSDGEGEVCKDQDQDSSTWEDIYGRKRDRDGNVIKEKPTMTKYIPPALRAKAGHGDLARLEKQMKGQINRLAESNMAGIARVIEDLYARNSRNDMNECLSKIFKLALVMPNALTPERLAMEHAVLTAILHANVGIEVGATITQKWVEGFISELDDVDRNEEGFSSKFPDNYIQFLAFLYAFKVIGNRLIFDLLFKLVARYSSKDIEMLILVLKHIGFNLRKDDPSRLKTLILDIQKKSADKDKEKEGSSLSREKFMLECLLAIRNNNVKKLPNYDPEHQIHLTKVMKAFLRPGVEVTPLNVKLDDLMNANTRGRWWIVGSAWTGAGSTAVSDNDNNDQEQNPKKRAKTANYSQELLTLAKKMRMNTDARRAIFCSIMSADDLMSAFENLVKIGNMKSPMKEKEVSFVLTTCCLREAKFNPFYPHLAVKLERYDRKYKMALQCAIWDKIDSLIGQDKSIEVDESSWISNLAKFTSYLVKEKASTLTCLKKIEFADLNKPITAFMKSLLLDILKVEKKADRVAPFALIAGNPKLSMLRESLRLFMHHFLLKKSSVKANSIKDFETRVEEAEGAMLATI